jgi:penicillin-binding protein 2
MISNGYSRALRANTLAMVIVALMILLAGRMFYMQTFDHGDYLEKSEENRIRVVPEIAVRGKILDRNGHVLVDNRPSYVIAAVPGEVSDRIDYVSEGLSSLLDVPAEQLADKIRKSRFRRYEPVRLKRDAPFETVCRLEEADRFPGVVLQLNQSRDYPSGGSASHLLGYLSEVTEAELDGLRGKRFHSGSLIGRKGVEKAYDSYLRGVDGTRYLEVTAEGKILGPLKERDPTKPIPGYDISLTLDYGLQQLGESLFGDTLSGAVVALNPNTGGVLAFVSQPSFDANLFTGPLSPEDWARLSTDERHPLLNRCIQATYPPGSTFKLVVAGAGLESGIISEHSHFLGCTGGYRYGNRVFHCHKLSGHGVLTLRNAVAASCDVYFYQLGKELGLQRFSEFSRGCGFGARTGIDIESEAAGLVPDRDYYDRRYGKGKWPRSLVLNLAIGQGELLTTPLQMAAFYAAVANGGTIYKPHVRLSMSTPQGIIRTAPEEVGKLPFSDRTLDILKQCAIEVVNGELGTAHSAQIDGTVVAGKTGTAQNPHGDDHAWFCAFAPADKPEIAVACIVENAGHGGAVAAPIVKKMIEQYLISTGTIQMPILPELLAEHPDNAAD